MTVQTARFAPAAGSVSPCIRTGCFPPIRSPATSRGVSMRRSPICRSSVRMATPIRPGSPRTAPFPDPARLFIVPDHYVHRMLYSQGIAPEAVGVPRLDGGPVEQDPRAIWRLFAANFPLFRGTPSWLWLDHAFTTVFGIDERPSAENADRLYDTIADALMRPEFRPRALFERFNIEVLATTDSPLDDLRHHRAIRDSGWKGRVVTAYRPDPVVDPDFPASPRTSSNSAASPARTPPPGPAISTRSPTAAPISKRWARPRPTTAIRRRGPPISPPGGRSPVRPGQGRPGQRRRRGTLPRPDADRNGAHEP